MSDLNDFDLINKIVDLESELKRLRDEQHTRQMIFKYPNYKEVKAEWEKILTALLTLKNLGENPETYDYCGDVDGLTIQGCIFKIEDDKLMEN